MLRPRALTSYRLTLGASAAVALLNAVFGFLVPGCWSAIVSRGAIPRWLVDLPFALPTAVAGIALTSALLRKWLDRANSRSARHSGRLYAPRYRRGAHFIGLPFVVRTLEPVLQDLEPGSGGGRREPRRDPLADLPPCHPPDDLPALLTGFTFAFARGLGEYGSVVFIAGNLPMRTEITTLLIMTKLEQDDYAGATALASMMLVLSFVLLVGTNSLHAWSRRHAA